MNSKNKPTPTAAERRHIERVKLCCVASCGRLHLARGFCQNHYMQQKRSDSESVRPRRYESDIEYVQRRITIAPNGCWVWQGCTFAGYGRLCRHGKSWPAHAFSHVAHGGLIPDGMQVNHKCHNRACVNPAHIYTGTQVENMADMREAGRQKVLYGADNGMARIDAATALEIFNSTEIGRLIGKKYGVSISLVYAIKKKKVWAHIHE